MKIDKKLVQDASVCGLKSFIILAGMIEELNVEPEVMSYEGPFGVGYMVCNFKLL